MPSLKEIESLLKPHGFTFQGMTDEFDFYYEPDELKDYGEDWQIALDIPNGGILAVDIVHKPTGGYWGCSTYERFGYHDDERIIAFAEHVIDEVEQKLAIVPGQLSLFEVTK